MILEDILIWLGREISDLNYDKTGTSGNVFAETLPSSPDIAVMGEITGGTVDSSREIYDDLSLRILIRGNADPRTSRDLADRILARLRRFRGGRLQQIGAFVINVEAVQNKPVYVEEDDSGRHKHSINFEIEAKE